MADLDSLAGLLPEDEDALRQRGIARPDLMANAVAPAAVRSLPAPPAEAVSAHPASPTPAVPAPAAPVPASAAAGSAEDLEAKALASHIAPPAAMQSPATRGLRPQPGDPEFAPAKMPTWQKILEPIALGAVAYHSPEQAGKMMDEFLHGPQREAQQRYEAAAGAYDKEQEDQVRQAQIEKTKAETAALGEPKPKEEKWDLFTGYTDTDRTPLIREENSGQVVRANDKKPASGFLISKGEATDKVTRVVNGVPHEILIDKQTGKDIRDLGQTKVAGETAGEKRSASEIAQVEREARGNVRKAEGQYRATEQSVHQLQAGIDAAKDGNGLLTSFVPTMEVLGINASNGVHRISPAEAQAAGMPGSFVERFNAFFDKAATGKLTSQLQTEGKALAKILRDSAYDRYKSTYDDESGIVAGYGGKDFSKHVPLIQHEAAEGQLEAPKVGTIVDGYRFKGGDPADQKNWEVAPKSQAAQ